jgi:hypothetical protein
VSRFGVRLRSPLRWLWAVMSALAVLAFAAVVQSPWLLVGIPPLVAVVLLGPPIGIFRHDETPAARTGLYLEALAADDPASAPGTRVRVELVNAGAVTAANFRIRIVIPPTLAPRGGPLRPLGRTFAGEHGRHWFIESVYDATAITFRSGEPDEPGAIRCAPGTRQALAELQFMNRGLLAGAALDYQISGGNAKPVLGRLELPNLSATP